LSTTYSARAGDTFETVARMRFGSEQHAPTIAHANPGISAPFVAGQAIFVPPDPGAPTDRVGNGDAHALNEVAITIDGVRYRQWETLRVTLVLDGVSEVLFRAPFDPDNADARRTFKPFTYKKMAITVGGSPLFTGVMVGVAPSLTPEDEIVEVSGYATAGVLSDCTPPPDMDLEFNDASLGSLARALASPFGIPVTFEGPDVSLGDRVMPSPVDSIWESLSRLSAPRNRVWASTADGGIVCREVTGIGAPVARFAQGVPPLQAVAATFHPQQYFSHVTGVGVETVGAQGESYTVTNTWLKGVLRPTAFRVTDIEGTEADVETATTSKAGRMFGNMAAYTLTVASWRDDAGKLWEPNTTVTLIAPGAMVYKEYEFLIRSVDLERTPDSETATLGVILPGAFNGRLPKALPWD